MSDHILAIDQGTTSTRSIVYDPTGRQMASSSRPITQYYPEPGWVNHDAHEIWEKTLETIRECCSVAGISPNQVGAIGITNQRETTVIWDRSSGRPLAPAIVWQSRQSAPWVDAITKRGMAETYRGITGLIPDSYFSATKIAMLLDQNAGLRAGAEAGDVLTGTIDSWLMWNLSGGTVHLTDVSNASRTMLFDIDRLEWSDRLLDDLRIPRQMLPDVVPSSGVAFETSGQVLGHPIRVAGIAGDQHAALFGQRCFSEGDSKCTYGTGAFLLANVGSTSAERREGILSTVGWGTPSSTTYALEGSVFIAGAAVQWLRDGLGIIESSSEVESLARSVDDTGGVTFVPAFVGLGAPHWDDSARGTMFGLTRGTGNGHLARATLEAIALQCRDVLLAMKEEVERSDVALRVDGGAAANDLLLQLQSDLSQIPVERPADLETTARGAAMLAGLGTGIWSDVSELAESTGAVDRFEPRMPSGQREEIIERWERAIGRSRAWLV